LLQEEGYDDKDREISRGMQGLDRPGQQNVGNKQQLRETAKLGEQ